MVGFQKLKLSNNPGLRVLLALAVVVNLLAAFSWQPGAAAVEAPQATTITQLSTNTLGLFGSASTLVTAPSGDRIAYIADVKTDTVNELILQDPPTPLANFNSTSFSSFQPTDFTEYQLVRFSPDAARIVFTSDVESDGIYNLYSRPANSTVATKLSAVVGAGQNVSDYAITPDSTRVIYLADQDTNDQFELYSAPVDGSSPAVKISGSMALNGDVTSPGGSCAACFSLTSAEGGKVIFLADKDLDQVFELYSVGFTGSGLIKLNPIYGATQDLISFRVNPNGARVIYAADQEVDTETELFTITPSGASISQVNASLVSGGDVGSYAISPDDTRVIYIADQTTDGIGELFSAPITGGASATKISGALTGSEDVQDFQISPTSSRVIYRADQDTDGKNELYTVPILGGASGKLEPGGGLPTDADVDNEYAISPDGNRVLFMADKTFPIDNTLQLFSAPADDSASAVELSSTPGAVNEVIEFKISPDSSRVIWRGDSEVDGDNELYSKPIAGGTLVQLNGALVVNGDVSSSFAFTGDGTQVIYIADERSNGVNEVFQIPPAGGTRTLLSGVLAKREAIGMWLSPDAQRVVYIADANQDNQYELFSVSSAGGGFATLSGTPAVDEQVRCCDTPTMSMRLDPIITANSTQVLFAKKVDSSGTNHLFLNGITSNTAPTQLNNPAQRIVGFLYSAQANRAVYLTGIFGVSDYQFHLFSVPLAGGAEVQLTPSGVDGMRVDDVQISPDGSRVIYLLQLPTSPGSSSSYTELWSAALDGSSPPVRLHSALPATKSINGYEVSPDSQQAVFFGDILTDGVNEIFRAPLNGSGAPLKIGPANLSAPLFSNPVISPDSRFVVFKVFSNSQDTLYAARLDNPQPNAAYLLSGSQANMTLLADIQINSQNSRVVFQVNQSSERRIYSAPLSPAGEPLLLASVSQAGFMSGRLAPDGARLVYQVDPFGAPPNEVYMIPIAGGSPVKLNSALPSHASASLTLDSLNFSATTGIFSADKARLLISADISVDGRFDVYYAPVGGGAFTAVNTPPIKGTGVAKALYSPLDTRVFFLGEQDDFGVKEVYVSSENRTNQTISAGTIPDRSIRRFPASISPLASASSGLPVTYYSATPQVCQVSGVNVTATLPGSCTIVVTQDGNTSFNPAPPVAVSFNVLQEIDLPLILYNGGAP
jgi:hypothetical protein